MNNKYFDLSKSSEKKEEKLPELFVSKYLSFHYEKVISLEESLTRLPTPEELFFLQSDNAFNAFTFIPFIAREL